MNKIFAGILATLLISSGASLAQAQTSGSSVLGTNGTTYNYNSSSGTYTASNGSTYNPSTGTYTANGTTYTYNPSNGMYYSGGNAYTYDSTTNTYTANTSSGNTANSTPGTTMTTPNTTSTANTSSGGLYNQSGTAVPNSATSPASPGIYYNANGQQLYYYGNGYYYNPATQTYGSTNSPGFVSTTYPGASPQYTQGATGSVGGIGVGAPNTGAGGEAATNWALILASGLVALSGSLYFLRRARVSIS